VEGGATSVGGFVGQIDGSGGGGTIPVVDSLRIYQSTIIGLGNVGGFAGIWNRGALTGALPALQNSSFEGTVSTGPSGSAGGIAGSMPSGSVHSKVDVHATISGTHYLGGLYGLRDPYYGANDLSFSGQIISTGGDNIGLIAGYVWNGSSQFNRVVASGSITNPNGAAVATYADFGNTTPTATQTYYRSSLVPLLSSRIATGLNESDFVNASSYTGFNFTTDWRMPSAQTISGVLAPVLSFRCNQDSISCL
jgi:hypothetical protein